eukprot:jgi/Mesen1/515/ME000104S10605
MFVPCDELMRQLLDFLAARQIENSQRELVGSFRRSYVYRVRGARVLPCNPSLARLTPRQRSDEKKYVKLVLSALSAPGLFVSYQADLTVSTQKREKAGPGFTSLPLWQQVRGSIPLLWEQVVDLTYKPRLKPVTSGPQASRVTAQHLRQLTDTYGSVLVLDLINQKGGEGQLGKLYASAMQELPGLPVRYVAFDFHKECGHLHFENLAALHKQIRETLQEQGYFVMTADRRVVREQKGVARTNCIDCLDRTNVTQICKSHYHRVPHFLLCHVALAAAAAAAEAVWWLPPPWATPPLDGQDALDLVTGGYVVNPNAPSPFAKQGIEKYTNLVVALSLMLAGAALAYNAILQVGERPVASVLTAVAGAGVAAAIGLSLKLFGREYTDRPRLCKLR